MKRNISLLFFLLTIYTYSFSQISSNVTKIEQKLILPVEKFIKIEKCCLKNFNHSSLIGIPVTNQLQITCDSNSYSIASFNGEVSKVINLNKTYSIFIKNEHFTLIYMNLEEIYIKEKDKINEGNKIGKIQTTNDKTILKLELFDVNGEKLDPEIYFNLK